MMFLQAESSIRSVDRFTLPSRLLVVLAGIVFGQFVLYAPSLLGMKLLLPLDCLAELSMYLPRTGGMEKVVAQDPLTSDLVLFQEPERMFAHREIWSGRFPLWSPYRFGGSPAYPLALSPPWVVAYLIESPVVVAWTNVLVALAAGFGIYLFARLVLRVSFWPAAIVAWCYPLSGAYVVWQGFWLPGVMCWLPWMLTAVDRAIRYPRGLGGPSLAGLTTIVLISGAQDVAGQVMLTSGLYGIWCYIDQHGLRKITREAIRSIAIVGAGWALGILATTWLLLPMAQYISTGSRMVGRAGGVEERPPVGLIELPQLVLPEMYGSTEHGSLRLIAPIVQEGSVAGYSGMLATLLIAPLAFSSRPHRSINIFWIILIFFSMSWLLNVPGMVQLMRLPGMNIMSHNRFVFVASLAILSMAAVGLEMLMGGHVRPRWWFAVPGLVLAVLLGWSIYRATHFPEPLESRVFFALDAGQIAPSIRNVTDAHAARDRFRHGYIVASVLSAIGVAGWIALGRLRTSRSWIVPTAAALMMADLLWFGYGRAPQCDPSMYYPRLPIVEQIAASTPGRVMGFGCLPANISQAVRLPDIRGYDGVDPGRMVELLLSVAKSESPMPAYALTQMLAPVIEVEPDKTWEIAPALSMLNVRYILFRGEPMTEVEPDLIGDDYWALVNPQALPRAFVPSQVYVVVDSALRLNLLSSMDFEPQQVAYVEEPVELPPTSSGIVSITDETPTRVTLAVEMLTPGLVVLSDIWDVGWRAYLDGVEVPILRTNHAVRGVVVPAGRQTLEFRYQPRALRTGLMISLLALTTCAAWALWVVRDLRAIGRENRL